VASQGSKDANILRDVEEFLSAARSARQAGEAEPTPADLQGKHFEHVGIQRLREEAGTPDTLLARATQVIWAAREAKGFLSEAECSIVLSLIAYHREWEQREAWRPTPLVVSGRGLLR
jgi:hypothetical protein